MRRCLSPPFLMVVFPVDWLFETRASPTKNLLRLQEVKLFILSFVLS